jgi:hypothetical protein
VSVGEQIIVMFTDCSSCGEDGYAGPCRIKERPLGDDIEEYSGFREDDWAIGITATMRSPSSPFWFVFVRHALVPVGHYYVTFKRQCSCNC